MPGVKADPVAFEDGPVFPAKSLLPVMVLLVTDVIADLGVRIRSDAEGTIALLPSKIPPVRKAVVNPFGCDRLDAVDQVCQRNGARRLEVQMDMISHSSGA